MTLLRENLEMKVFRSVICLTLVAAMLSGAAMADEKKGKGKGKKGRKAPSATQRFVGKMELTDEQKEQVTAIDKQFAERFTALAKKRSSILTDEQKKTQRDMMAKAKEGGKKGAELRKELQAALKLTDEQKAQQKELTKTQQELSKEIVAALKKVLTAEQQEKLPKQRGAAGGAKGKKKKKEKDAA